MKKRLMFLASIMMLFASLTGCAPSGSETIKIGVNLELTGPVAVYGVPEKLAFEMAVDEINKLGGINGKLVELVIYDNAYDSAKAVENATKLATVDRVVAMLGSATSAPSLAIAPLAKEFEVVSFTPSGTNLMVTRDGDQVNPFVFRAAFIDPFQGKVLANFASGSLEAKKAVIMGSNSSDYAKDLAVIFTDQFAANGGEVLDTFYYADPDKDFSAQLTSIQALGEFDVLFIADYAERAGLIIGQARSAGLMVPIIGPDGFESPDLVGLAGGADNVSNVFFSTHFTTLSEEPMIVDFVTRHKAFTGNDPSALSALAYDTIKMLFKAIETAGTDPVKIRDALAATSGFKGVTGTISFDAFNDPVKSAVIVELQNGEAVNASVVNP